MIQASFSCPIDDSLVEGNTGTLNRKQNWNDDTICVSPEIRQEAISDQPVIAFEVVALSSGDTSVAISDGSED